ncbi:MAG: thrombospondin type 3 repeat-containing protein [Candidatus Margulisbacteria bacterium]|nr:thrombospondin type 3 repeat-containing protein [Candidatus Margulisiibacteriota bacterium]
MHTIKNLCKFVVAFALFSSVLFAFPDFNFSVHISGAATGYWVGYDSQYIANVSDHWENYKYISMWVNNAGVLGDKAKIEIFDNDNSNWTVDTGSGNLGDDKWVFEFPMYWQNGWRQVIIPFSLFSKDNPGIGNGIMDFAPIPGIPSFYPGVLMLGFGSISATPTGITDLNINTVSLTNSTAGADSDSDGMPDAWEIQYGLNPNVNDANQDKDGDGITNFQEYINGSDPTDPNSPVNHQTGPVYTSTLPTVDAFERDPLVNPTWNAVDGLSIAVDYDSIHGTRSMKMNGTAGDYYAGYANAYIANPSNNWGEYKYVKVTIKNEGRIADKLKVQLVDNDISSWNIDLNRDDEFAYEFPILKKNTWKEVVIPFRLFTDQNSGKGNGVLNLTPNGTFASIMLIGLSATSREKTGSITLNIDDIILTNSTNGTDTDGDGMPDWWEIQYGLNPNNFADANGDIDGDGFTNVQEYFSNTNPRIANIFPIIENFEGFGYTWTAADGLVINRVNTTDTKIASNGSYSMEMTGTATNYYAGYASAWVKDGTLDINSSYKSLQFVLKNLGKVGDRIKIELQVSCNTGIDKWAFEQVLNNKQEWQYFTVPLNRFYRVTADSTGDGLMNMSSNGDDGRLNLLGFSLISRTSTGSVHIYIDNIQVSTQNVSDDTDGDGLPNTWEIAQGLNPLDRNGVNGANGNPAGDGFINIDKYFAGLSVNVRYPFPVIEDFQAPVTGWNITNTLHASYSTYNVLLSGQAVNYYVGYYNKYIGSYLFDWSRYLYIKLDLINQGNFGDKMVINVVDNDIPTFSVVPGGQDKWAIEITFPDKDQWHTYYVPFSSMKLVTTSVGNSTMDLKPVEPKYPGAMMLGFDIISQISSGNVNIGMGSIVLTGNIPANAVRYKDYYVTGITAPAVTINIHIGWNLLTLGITGNVHISQIIASINAQGGNVIEAYKFSGGTWVVYPGTDFTVGYGESFYIRSLVNSIYTPQGDIPTSKVYYFTAGWNSFGKSIGFSYTAKELGAEINANGLVLERIMTYDNGTIIFYDYITNTGTNFSTDTFDGFFLKFNTNYTWTPLR